MIKFYWKTDSVFDYYPSFIFGKSTATHRWSILTSNDLSESTFISFISPYNWRYPPAEEFYEIIKELKLKHPHIKILAQWKDEIIQAPEHDDLHRVFKLLVENNIFDKSEILVFSPNINDSVVYKYFTHASYKFAPTHYMIPRIINKEGHTDVHMKDDLYPNDDGRYFGTKPILENRIDLPREKKILSSARKWNHYRGTFYEKLLMDYSHLINDDNIIRFYDFGTSDTLPSKFGKRTYYDLFPHNEPPEKLENKLMQDCEEKYYEPLVENYLQSYVAVIHETCFPDFHESNNAEEQYFNQYHMTEKTLIPIASKCIIFTNSHHDFDVYLEKIGIKTFSHFFENMSLFEILDEINSWDMKKVKEFYDRDDVQEIIISNYNTWKKWMDVTYRDIQIQKELYDYIY